MLPSLPSTDAADVAGAPVVAVPPPPAFRAIFGDVAEAWLCHRNGEVANTGTTPAQKSGLRYEAKVQAALAELFGPRFFASPTLFFRDGRGGDQRAIPDGLLLFPAHTIVIEVKFQHMPEAWWQLRKKYEPILRVMIPNKPVLLLEICRSYDRQMPFPGEHTLYKSFGDFHEHASDGELGVFQWKL